MRWHNTRACGIVLALTLVTASIAEAQRRPMAQPPARQGTNQLMIGGTQLDINDLNARLGDAGYPTFAEEFFQLGFGHTSMRERLLLGFELAGLMRPAATTDDGAWRTRVAGGYGMFNIGYDAFREGGFSVQPKIGVGAGGVVLAITERAAPGFDDVLAQPGRGVQMTTGSLLLDGSLGVQYRMRPGTALGARNLVLGVRGGFTQSVLHGEWRRETGDAPGGPTAGWGGPHLEFLIGRTTRR
jgi:opacity protein-like surface antigen